MNGKKRAVAVLLVLAVAFVMLFDFCFLAAEREHECTGEDCPICIVIGVCEKTLHSVGLLAVFVFLAAVGRYALSALSASACKKTESASLVSLKVKLSN